MHPRSRLLRSLLFAAALACPTAAAAAPIVVTYAITGGSPIGCGAQYGCGNIVSGTIVVTMPNPGGGGPPLATNGHSIYFHFITEYVVQYGIPPYKGTFTPLAFPTGMAFRGPNKTLTAFRTFYTDSPPGGAPYRRTRFAIGADANGNLTGGFLWANKRSAEDTGSGWFGFTGQEISSTPEPASGALLALGGAGLAGALAAARRWRRPLT
jgi:hypothetical protein